jgi:hypothetical protein
MDDPTITASLQWLSEGDPTNSHTPEQQHLSADCTEGSGAWLLAAPEFEQWLADEKQMLLLFGPRGSGKSVLSSMVVGTLLKTFKADSSIGIAYLCCGGYKEHKSLDQLFSSIHLQLARRSSAAVARIQAFSQRFGENLSTVSAGQLFKLLTWTCATMSKVYVVVDEWHELSTYIRRDFLSRILELREMHCVSVLFTCHTYKFSKNKKFFGRGSRLCLDVAKGYHDQANYINRKMNDWPMESNPEQRRDLSTAIIERSSGEYVVSSRTGGFADSLRFIVVKLIMALLGDTQSPEEASKAIRELNPSILNLYTKLFEKIQKPSSSEERGLAQTALAWLVFAKAPLTGLQLRHALASADDSYGSPKNELPRMEDILALCEGFVSYDKKNDTCGILNATALKFLQETMGNWGPDAVVKGCLNYLDHPEFNAGRCESNALLDSRLAKYPLYTYAASHWADQFSGIPPKSLPMKAIRSFLSCPKKIAAACQVMLPVTAHGQIGQDNDGSEDPQFSGLHLAVFFGLVHIVEMLLKEGHRPASKDHRGRTPLWLATELRNKEVMGLLSAVDRGTFALMVDKGERGLALRLLKLAGKSIRDSRQRTALHISAARNDSTLSVIHDEILCGVDIDAKDMDGHTAIDLALQNSATWSIHELLTHGADTTSIKCSQWLKAHKNKSPQIVELSKHISGEKRLAFPTKEELRSSLQLRPKDTQRLM